MNKMLKNNKGFSLVELLIALLIMGVIAAIAIGLFGGVLNTSKGSADREMSETIRKALQNYVASTNDTGLEMFGATPNSQTLINSLATKFTIATGTTAPNKAVTFTANGLTVAGDQTNLVVTNKNIYNGDYGPFLDPSKGLAPQQTGKLGWSIAYHSGSQTVDISSNASAAAISVDSN